MFQVEIHIVIHCINIVDSRRTALHGSTVKFEIILLFRTKFGTKKGPEARSKNSHDEYISMHGLQPK